MEPPQHILLIVGSPKGSKSTSGVLGKHLIDKLPHINTDIVYLYQSLKTEQNQHIFLSRVDNADIIVLAFPLYVDSPPAAVMRAMELINQRRKNVANPRKQKIMAIINCGFPEAHQNDTALAICRKFAFESEFEWLGGLTLGGGGAVDGQPLDKLGRMSRNIKKSLDMAATDIANGGSISKEAFDLMAKPMMPVWLYLLGGNWGWKCIAKKNGVIKRINECPHQRERQGTV